MLDKKRQIDYLAEVIVSHQMATKELKDTDVYVHALGNFKRFFSKDVERVVPRRTGRDVHELDVYVHREGLYDLLPEGFFHSHSNKYFKDRRETIREFRRHRKEEKSARKFFMPLEQEFFRSLLDKEIFEQNFYYAPETIGEFIEFFELDHLGLNIYQQAALFYILPHIPKIIGNLGLTEACFEIIIQEKVRLKSKGEATYHETDQELPGLGSAYLGFNTICGNSFPDHNPGILIEIGPLRESDSLMSFISGIRQDLIHRMIELFIQADLTSKVNVLLNKQDEVFELVPDFHKARLNYSTTI